MRERMASKERRMLVRAGGMECWMIRKERQLNENNVKGGGMGKLSEQRERPAKENAGKVEGMECWLREKERPAKGMLARWREWNAEWERRKGLQRRMLARAEGMECWMREKERPAKENAGEGGGNGMLNEREGKASKGECWQGRRE
jgi:hypothetical protein